MKKEVFETRLSRIIEDIEQLDSSRSVSFDSALHAYLTVSLTALYSARRHAGELKSSK